MECYENLEDMRSQIWSNNTHTTFILINKTNTCTSTDCLLPEIADAQKPQLLLVTNSLSLVTVILSLACLWDLINLGLLINIRVLVFQFCDVCGLLVTDYPQEEWDKFGLEFYGVYLRFL
jgi:hypothetical protein